MLDFEVRSVEELRDRIPADVFESVLVSAPCAESANRQHLWDHERYEVYSKILDVGPIRIDEWWRCVYCNVSTRTAPIPPVEKPWPSITKDWL